MASRSPKLPKHLHEDRAYRLIEARWRESGYLRGLFEPLLTICLARLEAHHPTKATATGQRLRDADFVALAVGLNELNDAVGAALADADSGKSRKAEVVALYARFERWWDDFSGRLRRTPRNG